MKKNPDKTASNASSPANENGIESNGMESEYNKLYWKFSKKIENSQN